MSDTTYKDLIGIMPVTTEWCTGSHDQGLWVYMSQTQMALQIKESPYGYLT